MDHFTEVIYPGHGQVLTVEEVIYREQGAAQDIFVFRNARYGRVMALEGLIQVTEGDEFIYHEMMVHVPLFAHGAAENVLIIGGGDGGSLRHVLMHPAVKRVVMVEIEPEVVELAKKYFPNVCGDAFTDPRAQLIIGDGCAYVRETQERFDVIIIDSTDPVGPGKVLFEEAFYADCKRCLKPGGILRGHAGMANEANTELREVAGYLRKLFGHRRYAMACVPTYVPGAMVFSMAADTDACFTVAEAKLGARLRASGVACRYYTPALHYGSMALPQYMLAILED